MYLVILKKLVFVYKMGKLGCVVFDIINVCWNVDRVFLIFCDILGKFEGWFVLLFVLDVFDVLDVGMVGSVIDMWLGVFFLLFDLFYWVYYIKVKY